MGINKPNKIIVHHTGGTDAVPLADSSNARAIDIDNWHKVRWPGFTSRYFVNENSESYHVGYHFVIEKSGKVVQCRGLDEEGAHCIGQNTSSIGVCLSGNFDLTKPTKAQEKSFRKVYNTIAAVYPNITPNDIYPHRKYATKTCYGNNLEDDHFTKLLNPTKEQPVVKELQVQVVQLLTQLLELMSRKRMSKHQVS
jgi:N-acetyl-anhydromuramyl-L-alanine amidase AmpD